MVNRDFRVMTFTERASDPSLGRQSPIFRVGLVAGCSNSRSARMIRLPFLLTPDSAFGSQRHKRPELAAREHLSTCNTRAPAP
jgi:hypothetical protein